MEPSQDPNEPSWTFKIATWVAMGCLALIALGWAFSRLLG